MAHVPPDSLPRVAVLLVDDRADNLLALEAVLEPLGQRLVRARSGEEALAAVAEEDFAVILMDIRMPGLDGFETMALLHARQSARRVPIIFISGHPAEHHLLRSYAAGAVDYILKPIDPDAIRSKVSVFVHLRQNELALELAQAKLEKRVAERTAALAEANRALALEVTERKAAEQKLYERAYHDSLTGLANRSLFILHLDRAIARYRRRPEPGFALALLDVDRFKIVNDSLGHLAGDQLLLGFAQRLTGALREVDTVARLGGDEFAVLLDGVGELKEATRLAARIEGALAAPFEIDRREIFSSASIGIVMMDDRYACAEDVLRDADVAMYRAKAAGRGRYQVFDLGMHESVMAQLELESELRRAVERDELSLRYQPIVSLHDDTVVEVEALVRWCHATRGVLLPEQFVPLAEDAGLMRRLGRWVVERALDDLAAFQASGLDVTMSVNLSPAQLSSPSLATEIARIARRSGIDPRSLNLEVTETAVMTHREIAEPALSRLVELGVSISLDDFGSGYSCLGHLHRLPVGALKIDRCFVAQLEGDERGTVVAAIISLAHNLGMAVVAEGVETAAQAERLRRLGCDRAQGFLFAEPLEAEAARALCFERRPRQSAAS
jgi:diguanylate cyclase (GGDEF)-like protein